MVRAAHPTDANVKTVILAGKAAKEEYFCMLRRVLVVLFDELIMRSSQHLILFLQN
jgi:hypothetical protein